MYVDTFLYFYNKKKRLVITIPQKNTHVSSSATKVRECFVQLHIAPNLACKIGLIHATHNMIRKKKLKMAHTL
jgi:hypothetical protein